MHKLPLCFLFVLSFIGCGGMETFTRPRVDSVDIFMSDCKTEKGEETIEYELDGRDIIISHKNIPLPEYSEIGIKDSSNSISFETSKSYYILDSSERSIQVSEVVKYGSGKMCLYDFQVRIGNVSGGEYNLTVWGDSDILPKTWKDVWIY